MGFVFIRGKMIYFGFLRGYCRVDVERYERCGWKG